MCEGGPINIGPMHPRSLHWRWHVVIINWRRMFTRWTMWCGCIVGRVDVLGVMGSGAGVWTHITTLDAILFTIHVVNKGRGVIRWGDMRHKKLDMEQFMPPWTRRSRYLLHINKINYFLILTNEYVYLKPNARSCELLQVLQALPPPSPLQLSLLPIPLQAPVPSSSPSQC